MQVAHPHATSLQDSTWSSFMGIVYLLESNQISLSEAASSSELTAIKISVIILLWCPLEQICQVASSMYNVKHKCKLISMFMLSTNQSFTSMPSNCTLSRCGYHTKPEQWSMLVQRQGNLFNLQVIKRRYKNEYVHYTSAGCKMEWKIQTTSWNQSLRHTDWWCKSDFWV